MTTIRSVARASRILVYLGEQIDGRTAKEVADELELALPTAYHLLGTLVAEGLVAKDSRRRYQAGTRDRADCGRVRQSVRTARIPPRALAPTRRGER